MADRKITDLTALAAGSQATGDLLTIVDVSEVASTDKNKKITVESLFKGIPSNVGIGTTSPTTLLEVKSTTASAGICITADNAGTSDLNLGDEDDVNIQRIISDHSNNSLQIHTNNSERMRIDSSGRLLVGTSTSTSSNGQGIIQATSTSNDRLITAYNFENDANGPFISLGKSRGTSVGSFTILQNNDELGNIAFFAADGADLNTEGARIQAEVDGTPSTNDMPTRLVFATTADGANNPTERMRIDSSGNVGIGESSPDVRFHVKETINVAYSADNATSDANNLLKLENPSTTANAFAGMAFRTGNGADLYFGSIQQSGNEGDFYFANQNSTNKELMRIKSTGNVGIGTTSPDALLNISSTGNGYRFKIDDTTNDHTVGLYSDGTTPRFVSVNNAESSYKPLTLSGSDLRFWIGSSEKARIDSSGRLLIGATSSDANSNADDLQIGAATDSGERGITVASSAAGSIRFADNGNDTAGYIFYSHSDNSLRFGANGAERARITSGGGLLVATTNQTPGLGDSDTGLTYEFANGAFFVSRGDNNTTVFINKNSGSNSGSYMDFNKSGSAVGNIGHNGSGVVSYNNFQGSHLGRLVDRSTPDIKVGTLIEVTGTPLDYKCVPFTYTDVDGETQKMRKPWTGAEPVGATVSFDWNGTTYSGVVTDENAENDYEKSLYTQVCATAASKAVLGVFMCWDDDTKRLYTDSYNDMLVTSVGNFVVRMASGQTPVIGDLFESDANGCAVVQTDDIIRSKTIGKITSTEKQVVYDDGSFLVTCVLYSG